MTTSMGRPEALLLLFVLLFSPLAFGTVEPWSRAIAEGAALAGLALALRRRTHDGRLRLHTVPGTRPLLLFLGFVLLQCLPLPPWLLHVISPAAYGRWAAALGSAGPLPWLPLSLDPLDTLREFFRFCSCAALYALTVLLFARRERLRVVTTALAVFAAVLSFAAILQFLVVPGRLLFVRTSPSQYSFGPFVNRNHYANLLAMLAPVVFGLFLGRGFPRGARTLRERFVDLLARPESSVRLLLGFAALLSAASLVISLSRGATIAVSAALLVFGGCLVARGLGRRRVVAAALLMYTFAVFVGWFGWEKVTDRFARLRTNPDIVDATRAGIWTDTLRMAGDFPVLGAGIGSFGRLYPVYRTVPGPLGIDHAHNDYLELLAGGGAVGLGLCAWFVTATLTAVVRACRRRRDPPTLYLTFGSLAGCVAFLVHGASDFSLAIGANALYFFFLLGLAVSASHTLGPHDDQSTLLDGWSLPAFVTHGAVALALVSVLGSAADLTARHAWSLAAHELQRSEALPVPLACVGRLIGQASWLQPFEPAYPAASARIALREGNTDEALRLTRRALRLLPVDAVALMQLGTILSSRGDDVSARRSFTAAIACDPAAPLHRETFAAWLLSRGDQAAAIAHVRAALALEPLRAPGIFSMLLLAGFDDEKIAAVIPPEPAALLQFARYATATGARRLAENAYRRILTLDPGNHQATAGLRSVGPSR